jgi:hypothetical protein
VEGLQCTFNDVVAKLRELMDILQVIAKPLIGPGPPVYSTTDVEKIKEFFIDGFEAFKDALKNASIDTQDLLKPLKDLIDELKNIIETGLLQSFFDELQNLLATFENSDYLEFSGMKGLTETLPVSLNCIALKPGVTVNLTAIMVRAGDASLNAWRMETFDRLNQAWYQMDADYQARLLMKNGNDFRANPGLMRQDEQKVIKDRVIKSLLDLHSASPGNVPDLDQLKLFEHAIDWDNMSYRLYNYSPKGVELVYEKLGLYKGADERRKAFVNALWAQALIPLKADERLESFMMGYFQTGQVKTLDELIEEGAEPDGVIDEIAAIYRDIILKRDQLAEQPLETHRREIVPTELMVIHEGSDSLALPVNETAMENCNG